MPFAGSCARTLPYCATLLTTEPPRSRMRSSTSGVAWLRISTVTVPSWAFNNVELTFLWAGVHRFFASSSSPICCTAFLESTLSRGVPSRWGLLLTASVFALPAMPPGSRVRTRAGEPVCPSSRRLPPATPFSDGWSRSSAPARRTAHPNQEMAPARPSRASKPVIAGCTREPAVSTDNGKLPFQRLAAASDACFPGCCLQAP